MSTEGSKKIRSSNFLSFAFLKGDYLEEIIMGEGVSLPSGREYFDRQDALKREDLFYRIPNGLPALSDGLRTETATTAYATSVATTGEPTGVLGSFITRSETLERGLPADVYSTSGYNWGPAAYANLQLGGYADEHGNDYTFGLLGGGLVIIRHQSPSLPAGYMGFATSGSFSSSEDGSTRNDPYSTNGGHFWRGYIHGGASTNLLGIPGEFSRNLFIPHNELINGIYAYVTGGYGTGRTRAYSDKTYTAGTGIFGTDLCLVGLDETLGLCFGNTWLFDQYKWTRDDGQTESGWNTWSTPTVTIKIFEALSSRDYRPNEPSTDRIVNSDVNREVVDHSNADTYYTGRVSNGLHYVVTELNMSEPEEYIRKVHPDADADGMPDGLYHLQPGDDREDAKYVREVKIIFTDRVQDLDYEKIAQGESGSGLSTDSTSMLNREIVMHAGPKMCEYFVYEGFVYRVILNTEPEKVVVQSYKVGTSESELIFSGQAVPVLKK